MQSMFEAFTSAETAYRHERIATDFAKAGWRSPRRHTHRRPATSVGRAFSHLHLHAGAVS